MSAIQVERHMFTIKEVVAAILPNVGRAREIELRIDGDGYVVVDIVGREAPAAEDAQMQDGSDFPGDTPAAPPRHEPPADARSANSSEQSADPGPREDEARGLCRTPLFRAFLEVKTEEAAVKVMADRCHVNHLADLDRTRSNGMNLRHVVEEFEAWKIT